MHPDDLDYFRKNLEALLYDLQRQANDTVISLREIQGNEPDPLDRAAVDAENNFRLRIRGRESILINKVQKSLEAMEEGEYGICEDCGGDISIARLHARPVASRCIRCKTKQEQRARAVGYQTP